VILIATPATTEAMLKATIPMKPFKILTMGRGAAPAPCLPLQLPLQQLWARVEQIAASCHAHREYKFLFLGWRKAAWSKILNATGARTRG